MMITQAQRDAWSSPPVDDVGYVPASDLMALGDDSLRLVMDRMMRTRYQGWRNHKGLWVKAMKLDSALGLNVLDYGCGVGIEAVKYAQAGARVSLGDISWLNLHLAARVMRLYGYRAAALYRLEDGFPQIPAHPWFDVVNMSGVLHHIENPRAVMAEVTRWLDPGGEVRVMVYSDEGWRIACGSEPPREVARHPQQEEFTRFFDQVGEWADWYDGPRLEKRFGRWFDVEDVTYITPDRRYLTATLRRRNDVDPVSERPLPRN